MKLRFSSSLPAYAGNPATTDGSVNAGCPACAGMTATGFHEGEIATQRRAGVESDAKRLERMLGQLGETALEVRKSSKLAYPIVQRALLSIAYAARRKE